MFLGILNKKLILELSFMLIELEKILILFLLSAEMRANLGSRSFSKLLQAVVKALAIK